MPYKLHLIASSTMLSELVTLLREGSRLVEIKAYVKEKGPESGRLALRYALQMAISLLVRGASR
jgi:hypothetical protein